MGRSLSAFLGALCLIWAGTALAVDSASSFRSCIQNTAQVQDVQCLVKLPAIEQTSGTAEITSGIFYATLPTNRVLDIEVKFENPGCFIWDHTGASEPGNTSNPVEIIKINVPAGVQAGSRLRFVDPCVQEWRNGVPGGNASTVVEGIKITGAGVGNLTVTSGSERISITSSGSGTQDTNGVTAGSAYSGSVAVLIGGEDGVDDDADPNVDPIICSNTNAACLYLSSESGWWTATSSNATTATDWAPISSQILLEQTISARANTASHGAATCMAVREQHDADSTVPCGDNQYTWIPPYGVTVTRLAWAARASVGIDSQTGCSHCLTTDGGSTCLTGSTLEYPDSNDQPTDGQVEELTGLSISIAAGTRIGVSQANGSFCGAGSGCVCVGDEISGSFVIEGFRHP